VVSSRLRNLRLMGKRGNSALNGACRQSLADLAMSKDTSTNSACPARRDFPLAVRSFVVALTLGLLSFAAPGLLAQYSVTKFIDPNTFPADTTPGFALGGAIATDGTYTAISTSDAVWSKTVAGGTPVKLFSVGTNLPSSTTAAAYIYGAVEVSDGIVVFYANGAASGGTLYGIYSVKADGSAAAVRVADSTQVATGVWGENADPFGRYGLFDVAKSTVVFSLGGAIFSAGVDGSKLTTLWQTNTSFTGCQTAGQDAAIFPVTGAFNATTDGTNYAYTGASDLSFVALYTEPLGTQDQCNDLITSGVCNICGPVNTLPGQPRAGIAFAFQNLVQIDGDYVYFMADAGGGVSTSEDYYGIFKVPLAGGPTTAVVTNLSQLPLLKTGPGTYDEPGFGGYAVKNGKFIVYAGDDTQGGTAEPAFYMLDGTNWITLFSSQTSVSNECMGNMTDSSLAGLVQPELSSDGHLYFSGEFVTTGPDLNGSCGYSFLRFQPYAYYVLDTTHPLIPAQTTITTTPVPASITTSTPVTLNFAVSPATGASNPGSLIPTGMVNVYFTSPQIFGTQNPGSVTLDNTGKGTLSLGDLEAVQYNFTVSYGGDSNFTQSGSNTISFDLRPPAAASLSTPAPGSTLPGSSVTFSWAGGVKVSEYALMLGTTGVGSSNLFSVSGTTETSQAVTGLPANGVTIYARLSSMINGAWQSSDYTYTAYMEPPVLTTPTPGSVLTGPSATFKWTAAAAGNVGYWLFLGTTGVGSKNLLDTGLQAATSATFSGLPVNGETIYARVYTKYNGTLVFNDYTYTAFRTLPVLTSPTPGSTLTSASATFKWTAAAAGNQGYWLILGTTGVGSRNLYDSGQQAATSATFSSLPTDGATIYARVYTKYNAVLVFNDYTYKAWMQPAVLTSPTPGSTLAGPSVAFTWTAESGNQGYWLFLGTTGAGSKNLLDTGQQTANSATFSSLPTNGATIYARVYTLYNGVLVYNDYTYKAAAQAVLTTPTPGSTFAGAGATFDWTAATGSGNKGYWLFLGTTGVGSKNLYDSGQQTATSATFNSLPTNGAKVYARVYTDYNGVLVYNDYTYTAH
jgi:Bacterial Ig-like domain (group 3)